MYLRWCLTGGWCGGCWGKAVLGYGRYGMTKDITYEAAELLRRYEWPGNVREMENVIERLVVSTFHDTISETDIRKMMPAFKRVESEETETRG